MRVKCSYCGDYIDDTELECPNCGAANDQLRRSADDIPQTMEELKIFATQKRLPLNQMRFFIDCDMREARAYGIYKDEAGNFIVYKNKSNGERAIRYKGSDEAYAVNEIYQKLRMEMAEQKLHQAENLRRNYQSNGRNTYKSNSNNSGHEPNPILIIIILFWIILILSKLSSCSASYYDNHRYNNSYYNSGYSYDYDNDYGYNHNSHYNSYDSWDYGWDDNDWDYDFDWDSSYSDWDSDW